MDPEAGPAGGHQVSPREGQRPYKVFLLAEKELEEVDSDPDDQNEDTKDLLDKTQDLLDKIKQHCDENGKEFVFIGPECPGFFQAYPACVPHESWEIRGGEEETSPCSMFKCWVCQDKQHSVADCVRNPTHPDPPTTGSSPASLPVAGPVTTSNMSSVVNYTRGPSSLSDAFRCTPTTPCSPEWNPVNAAAHLHLLGEALSLIGLHLKGTNNLVSVSSSLSLLLDSVLCALAPLTFLTAAIPELGSCTQHTLASTLENIAYLMPGM